MKKTKTQKGITLIALIITIVVLMILAAVAINSITNEGIIGKAEGVTDKYKQEQIKEQDMLEYYESILEGTPKITVRVAQAMGALSEEKNIDVYDEYGNKIVVPAGFKITTDADTVQEGIVIEDCTDTVTRGSQFVWIPVGNVKSSIGTKTITLGRYVFADGSTDYDGDGTNETAGEIIESLTKTNPKDPLKEKSTYKPYYIEALKDETVGNEQARDIQAFITSANTKGGYYIGRYEARDNSGTVTTVPTDHVWNEINQKNASVGCKDMYGDGYKTDGTGTFSSDLINSLAWDTAIVFIQAFGDNDYSQQKSLNSGSPAMLGTHRLEEPKQDKVCNIWDMASNCEEWSTETVCGNGMEDYDCVMRGGSYRLNYCCAQRGYAWTSYDSDDLSFRPLLYVAL